MYKWNISEKIEKAQKYYYVCVFLHAVIFSAKSESVLSKELKVF